MNQYNFPTTMLTGEGALNEFGERIKSKNHKKILIVSDETLKDLGIIKKLTDILNLNNTAYSIFTETHANPHDGDVENGVAMYKAHGCDSIIAIGGGSPIDVAKVIKIMVSNPPPLIQYDDAAGGDSLISGSMPPLYAIATTAGTGSEVGRAGVIIMRETGKKTIFFHPELLPDIAVLEPELTIGLPAPITAATGIDAFSHSIEAYFSPGFHPMADGIALQSIELILDWLPVACKDGGNIEARTKMLVASSMGAIAFQKGLGMIHSLAHPLSSQFGMHHGLANALLIPDAISFFENKKLNEDQNNRIKKVLSLFEERSLSKGSLSESCRVFFESLGIKFKLSNYKITSDNIESLSEEAFADSCHSTNMIPVTKDDLAEIYRAAL